MTYVVTESCIKCKYTDCVDVCPVDCFREGPNFLVIDPEECIDCTLCVAECPVEAIFAEDDVPDAIEIGYDGFTVRGEWPDHSYWGFEIKDSAYIGKFVVVEDNTAPGTKGGPGNPYVDLIGGVYGGVKLDRGFDVLTANVLSLS